MKRIRVTAAVTATPLGETLGGLWDSLLEGRSSITPVKRFAVDHYPSGIGSCFEDLPAPPGRSACLPLVDRAISQLGEVPAEALLITATTKAGIDNLERWSRGEASHPGDVFPQAVAQRVRAKLGLTGGWFNVGAACASSSAALSRAAALIAAGVAPAVVVVCVDLLTEFVFSGFCALQVLSSRPCRPFDRNRDGMSLGEGAAALVLMDSDRCRPRDRQAAGEIVGWGVANDAHHLTAPARDGRGLVQAITRALQTAGVAASDIAAISAHGTATVYNDAMELKVFQQVFGDRRIPVYSIKGAIGHTLGAAGGIEAAIGLQALARQIVPPTVGFQEPEPEAEGRVSGEAVPITGRYLLITNAGFGGINAALVVAGG